MGDKADKYMRISRPAALIGTFLLFAGGCLLRYTHTQGLPLQEAIKLSCLYALPVALIFLQVADLVLARGLLQVKIIGIKILTLLAVIAMIVNHLLGNRSPQVNDIVMAIEAAGFLAAAIVSALAEHNYGSDFIVDSKNNLPAGYTRIHPLKTFLESLFRLFPCPVPVGLYRIGNPDNSSPVLATGNFDLTVRRVVERIKDTDCRLLVCDSRGVNIWCSTLAGHFGTAKIIEAIEITKLAEKTGNRTLLLPQLCAAGVSTSEIRKSSGFGCKFGPIRIKDIGIWFKNPADKAIRKITFTARERLEMAFGTLIFPIILLGFIYNFIDPRMLLILLPAIYGLSFLSAWVYPKRFIRNIRLWSLFCGALVFGLSTLIFSLIPHFNIWPYAITIGIAVIYLINEFEGWSPLVKFSMTGAYKLAEIEISAAKCTGCGRCIEVCPKAVYELQGKKSTVIALSECISCKSCIAQCPAGAITHSAASIDETL